MNIAYNTRPLYPDEQRVLRTLKDKAEKQRGKLRYYHFPVAGALAAVFAYLAANAKTDFWVFVFGTIAVFATAFIVFMPYEMYKARKARRAFQAALDHHINSGTVATCHIKANKIAVAKEYEDEGELFIIELSPDHILFLWDCDYSFGKKFPCLDFEIYEENFARLVGKLVYPLSERTAPMVIDSKAKWGYMGKIGAPGHLEMRNGSFDQFVDEMNSYGLVTT